MPFLTEQQSLISSSKSLSESAGISTMSVVYSQEHQPPQQSDEQCIALSQYLAIESQLSAFRALAASPILYNMRVHHSNSSTMVSLTSMTASYDAIK